MKNMNPIKRIAGGSTPQSKPTTASNKRASTRHLLSNEAVGQSNRRTVANAQQPLKSKTSYRGI